MASVPALVGRLGLDATPWRSNLVMAQRRMNAFGVAAKSSFASVALKAGALGAALIGVRSIAGSFARSLSLAASAEQTEVAFTTMIGSATKARNLLGELRDFAASTPFQLPDLQDAGRKLLAFGTGAGQVTSELRKIGDISAGVQAPIGEIAEIYGKARVQGTLFAEDINQLTGRGIPVIQEFAKQLGVSEGEVKKLASQGKITFDNLQQAFTDLTADGGKFENMMAAQSQTLGGLWSTLKDNISAALLEIGIAITDTFDLKSVISNATQWIIGFVDKIKAGAVIIKTLKDNIGQVFEIMTTSAALQLVRLGANLQHYLYTVPKSLLTWLVNNWQEAFRDLYNVARTAMMNIAKNITANFQRIVDQFKNPLQDISLSDFRWQPLLDGFESGLKELPKIPDRVKGPLEKNLESMLGTLTDSLGGKIGDALAKLNEPIKPTIEEDTVTSAAGAGPTVPDAGQRQVQFAGGAAQSTQAAYSAIVQAMSRSEGQQVAKQQLSEQKKSNKLLEEIAANAPPPVRVVESFA